MKKKIIIDPNKVIKVEPKKIYTDYKDRVESVKKSIENYKNKINSFDPNGSKIDLPPITELTFNQVKQLVEYGKQLSDYLNKFNNVNVSDGGVRHKPKRKNKVYSTDNK
jgi:hypothetical protein